MLHFTHDIPLTLYIHIPWCVRKCPYCDFNSHKIPGTIPEKAYLAALINDLELDLGKTAGRRITSIFFGGGTPSLLSASSIGEIIDKVAKTMPTTKNLEVTLEANPGTVEQQKFADFKAAGVNRLSIGVQSFQNEKLKVLGRIHDRKEAIKAVEIAQKVGLNNLNIDLMYGLPQQSVADALSDLKQANQLNPAHLSWYQLTIEKNTIFYKSPPRLPEEAEIENIEMQGSHYLAAAGYKRYEVSAYSKDQSACQHNLNYWQYGDYLGIGAGAHSKLTDMQKQCITRFNKVRQPKDYLAKTKTYISQEKVLQLDDIAFEFFMNTLRLYQPISYQLFTERTGLPIGYVDKQIKYAAQENFIDYDEQSLWLTAFGQKYLNNVIEVFLPKG